MSVDGTVLCDGDKIKERRRRYCYKLYEKNDNLQPIHLDLMVSEPEPPSLIDEVKEAIKDPKYYKSPGADEITAELIKNGGPNIEAFYHKLCCKVWNDQKWPADWVKSIFVLIPKKGDTLQCTNNRNIALKSHSSRILLKIMAKRMHWKMKAEIAEEQTGFKDGRGTRNQVLNLEMVIEKNREHSKDLFLCFFDCTKAFDTVAHDILLNNMQDMGFPEYIILLLKSTYSDQNSSCENHLQLNGLV